MSRESNRRYYLKHRERIRATQAVYRKNHHAEVLEGKRRYRESHREQIADYMKTYRDTHPDEIWESNQRRMWCHGYAGMRVSKRVWDAMTIKERVDYVWNKNCNFNARGRRSIGDETPLSRSYDESVLSRFGANEE